jgi:filamentous hemagglutinin
MGGSELAYRAYQHGSAVYAAKQKGGWWGATKEHFKQSIPILGVYDMGENFVHTIEEGDPEKIGAASLPIFEGVVGIVAGGKLAGVGKTSVYRSRNTLGQTQYVGITRFFLARSIAHLRLKGIQIERIQGLTDLSLADGRAVEQVLIEHHGLSKNGGTLLNKINSIAESNPVYTQALIRGSQLLRDVGYDGF